MPKSPEEMVAAMLANLQDRLCFQTCVTRSCEPTALAAGFARPTSGPISPEASACGSRFETMPSPRAGGPMLQKMRARRASHEVRL